MTAFLTNLTAMLRVLMEYETDVDEHGFGPWWALILGLLVSVGFLTILICRTVHIWRNCTHAVNAACVDISSHVDEEGTTLYSPIWEYEFEGELLRVESDTSSTVRVPKIGDTRTLYIDTADPKTFRNRIPIEFFVTLATAAIVLLILWAMYEKHRLGG